MMTGSTPEATRMFTSFSAIFSLGSRIVFGICAAAFVFFLVSLGYMAMQWQRDWTLAHKSPVNIAKIEMIDETEKLIDQLPSAHLFGNATNKGDVPTSHLQLQITGIVKAKQKNSSQSKAYISIDNQPSKIYQLGDNLTYGVKIHSIMKDAVIVENNGRLEKILLPRRRLQFKLRGLKENA